MNFNKKIGFFCINLKKETSRWEKSLKEFEKISIDKLVVRFSWIEYPKNGHYWCMRSHEEIIKIAIKEKYEKVVVFEDDIIIKNPEQTKKNIINLLQENFYDIAYLWWLFLHPKVKLRNFNDKYLRIKYLYGWHAIIYNMSIYKKFLEKLETNRVKIRDRKTTFDEILAKEIQQEDCCIITKNWLVEQKRGFSSTEIKNKWYLFYILNSIWCYTSKVKYIYTLQYIFFSLINILIKKITL